MEEIPRVARSHGNDKLPASRALCCCPRNVCRENMRVDADKDNRHPRVVGLLLPAPRHVPHVAEGAGRGMEAHISERRLAIAMVQ